MTCQMPFQIQQSVCDSSSYALENICVARSAASGLVSMGRCMQQIVAQL